MMLWDVHGCIRADCSCMRLALPLSDSSGTHMHSLAKATGPGMCPNIVQFLKKGGGTFKSAAVAFPFPRLLEELEPYLVVLGVSPSW